MRKRIVVRVLCGLAALAVAFTNQAQPAQAKQPACVTSDALSLVERGRASTTPCTLARHGLMLETGYYQNASAVGGTALAAYPLAHLRYGLSSNTELFIDPATAIAKSGLNGAGLYTWTRSGAGLRMKLRDTVNNVLAANLEYTPQADETASLSTRERFVFGLRDRLAVNPRFNVALAFGEITFTQQNRAGNQQSSLYGRLSLSEKLNRHLSVSQLVGRDAKVARDATPQTKVGIAVHDALTANTVGDVELGSALNAAGNTKAHYLGFGISFLK